jgi:hypothetical protein
MLVVADDPHSSIHGALVMELVEAFHMSGFGMCGQWQMTHIPMASLYRIIAVGRTCSVMTHIPMASLINGSGLYPVTLGLFPPPTSVRADEFW